MEVGDWENTVGAGTPSGAATKESVQGFNGRIMYKTSEILGTMTEESTALVDYTEDGSYRSASEVVALTCFEGGHHTRWGADCATSNGAGFRLKSVAGEWGQAFHRVPRCITIHLSAQDATLTVHSAVKVTNTKQSQTHLKKELQIPVDVVMCHNAIRLQWRQPKHF